MSRNYKTVEEFKKAKKHPIILVLENIRSLNNVGSFFRTADSFLLESIYLCGITGKPPHREIEKTALGATLSVNWQYFSNIIEAIELLKKNNYFIISVEQNKKSIFLQHLDKLQSNKIALIFGNEVNGISEQVLEMSDLIVEIPQMGTKHSLNVTVCAGIVCWDLLNKMNVLK